MGGRIMNDTPETDRMMEEDRHHWEDEETVFITAYLRMVSMARQMEWERNEATKTALMWKANHDNQAELKSIISKRGDLRDRAPRVEKLIAERDELKRWKEGAISVMPPIQEIGKEIGVVFGQTIHDKILPELIRRRETARRLERERDQAQYLVKTLSAKCDKIEADKEYNAQLVREFRSERDQLRDAVKWALGETGDFGPRPKCGCAYCWREELRRRAGIFEQNKTTKNE